MHAADGSDHLRIAVLASGEGSNLQAIIDAIGAGRLPNVVVKAVLSDKPGCRALARAERAGVPTAEFPLGIHTNGQATAAALSAEETAAATREARAARDRQMIDRLNADDVDLVVLAGYMQILSSEFISAFDGRIINVHPSLLPRFPGLDAIEQAVAAGVSETGVTVHYVDEGVDTGPVIAQRTVKIVADETIERLTERIHAVEHELLPDVIGRIAAERFAESSHPDRT